MRVIGLLWFALAFTEAAEENGNRKSSFQKLKDMFASEQISIIAKQMKKEK